MVNIDSGKPPYFLIIKYPSRERKEHFFKYLLNMLDKIEDKANYLVICSFDFNDPKMNNPGVVIELEHLQADYNIQWHIGNSQNKVHAINRDMPKSAWDIVFSMSDDMWCNKQGWDNDIRRAMEAHFADTDGFLHFWDGDGSTRKEGGRGLCTYSIIGRKYYDRFGYIYHPSYKSLWCDNEATDVAQGLGRYAYMDEVLFQHVHFSNNPEVVKDRLMVRTQSFFGLDQNNYNRRKRAGFPK